MQMQMRNILNAIWDCDMTRIQLLVAAVKQDTKKLPLKMNIQSDAIIINQRMAYGYEERECEGLKFRIFNCDEKGVGLSRNLALLRADHELLQFCDEDIVLDKGYTQLVENEFDKHPEADMLLFNVKAANGRETYHNVDYKKITPLNYGRYPAYAIAARREVLQKSGVTFSLLFGGGAKYSNGEDSLFLKECLDKKIRIYRTDVSIGHEESDRPSTWFSGYNEKFFIDRGYLYHFLYGKLAVPMCLRFLIAHKGTMCKEISLGKAFDLMKRGVREAEKPA